MYSVFFDVTLNGGGGLLCRVRQPSDVTGDQPHHLLSDDQTRDRRSVSVIIPSSSELMTMIVGEDYICFLSREGVASYTYCLACK